MTEPMSEERRPVTEERMQAWEALLQNDGGYGPIAWHAIIPDCIEEIRRLRAVVGEVPSKRVLGDIAEHLDQYRDNMGRCPCYDGSEGYACTCDWEAEVIVARDWLRKLAGGAR